MPDPLAFAPLPQKSVGQLQNLRAEPALHSQHFSAQERSFGEWLAYIYSYAQRIRFYAENQFQEETWQATMPDPEQFAGLADWLSGKPVSADIQALGERPDISLLLAFIDMQQRVKIQFDAFSERHKQFYYRDILGLQQRPAQPDKAHLVLTLDTTTPSMTLEKGRRFNGGDDADGNPLIYQSLDNAVINHSQVDKLFSLNSVNSRSGDLLISHHIDASTGLTMPEEGIFSFGEAELSNTALQSKPQLGFVIISELLYLSGGTRQITLGFTTFYDDASTPDILSNFDIYMSTAEGRHLLNPVMSTTPTQAILDAMASITMVGNTLKITLPALFPAITHLAPDIAPGGIASPFIEFVLKADSSAIETIQSRHMQKMSMSIQVDGLSNALLNFQAGFIDSSESFEAFGQAPRKNNNLDFTHPELLIKNIDTFSLTLNWMDIPASDLVAYYSDYDLVTTNGQPWLLDVTASDSSSTLQESLPILVNAPAADTDTSLRSDTMDIVTAQKNDLGLVGAYKDMPIAETLVSAWPRWFSLTLKQNDFGHHDYSQISQKKNIAASQSTNPTPEDYVTAIPYTPKLQSFEMSYSCEQVWDFDPKVNNDKSGLQKIDLMGYQPFDSTLSSFTLAPSYNRHGYLYLGIGNISAPGQCRIYFEMDVVDGANTTDQIELKWEFLLGNKWQRCSRSKLFGSVQRVRIIEDSTMDLLDSGIMVFELPKMDFSTFLQDGLLWIRVSARDLIADSVTQLRYSRIKKMTAQGVEVELVSSNNAAAHFDKPLAAQSIGELESADYRIENVVQPYPSFSAKAQESADSFSVRISERLRHRQRALNAWDIERLVLAEFTDIYQARCYYDNSPPVTGSSTNDSDNTNVKLMLIPINHDARVLQPKLPLYLKRRIEAYINRFCMVGESIRIVDANYLQLQVNLKIRIHAGFDSASSVIEINQLLIDVLSPWNHQSGAGQVSSAQLQLADIARKIIQHPAVSVILSLDANVLATTGTSTLTLEDWFTANSNNLNSHVLVSASQHEVSIVNQTSDIIEGIESWEIEYDFVVG